MLLKTQAIVVGGSASGRTKVPAMGVRAWQHVLLFVIAYALLMSRKPDAFFHAQFWAEDGRVWFADAYNLGPWRPFLHTETGYFQTLPRLAADLALFVPLLSAPLVMNLLAVAVHTLPVNLLISDRSAVWGSLRMRALLAAAYLAIPSSPEIAANITNEQWTLAFCAFLLLVGSAPASPAMRALDVCCMLLSGLTGPFCIFLLPIALLIAFRRSGASRWIPPCILAVCSAIQFIGLTVISPTARSHWGVLGARFDLLVRILGGNVFIGAIIGSNNFAGVPGTRVFIILAIAAAAGCAIAAASLIKAPLPMRLMALYAALLLAAALALPSSYAPPGTGQWEMIAKAGAVRYWFLPTLTFIWLLLYGFTGRNQVLKVTSAAILFCLCIGIEIQWKRPAFPDLNYPAEVRRIEAAPPGTALWIPINPDGWHMRIIKRADTGSR
ncbi:hypothetical protein [Occallatibacter savannae]|uniref:hypothetical protein n=1 Tax=Occallatibacter savannae TaxID=1002691 RepID=UPI000D686B19|nr:hypothetical protein [Occallatibacter savannae]